MRLLVLLLLLLPLPASAQTSPAVFDNALVDISFGVFCAVHTEGSKIAPGTEAGEIGLYTTTPSFEWLTNKVPARLGMTFAVKTTVVGGFDLDPVIITLNHPRFPGVGTEVQTYVTSFDTNSDNINAYTFDVPHELTLGEWEFEAVHNGKTVYRVGFQVVDPALLPQIAGSCGGDLSS